jgi:putative oxidoreductase
MNTLAAHPTQARTEAGGLTALAQQYAPLAGRIGLSAIFLLSGAGKIANWAGTAGYMAFKGMPAVPFFLAAAIVFELAGGLALLTGYRARAAAVALIVFLIPATLIFHNFWTVTDAMEQQNQMIHFLKNVAIAGGLLTVVAHGAGPLSLDQRNRSNAAAK